MEQQCVFGGNEKKRNESESLAASDRIVILYILWGMKAYLCRMLIV